MWSRFWLRCRGFLGRWADRSPERDECPAHEFTCQLAPLSHLLWRKDRKKPVVCRSLQFRPSSRRCRSAAQAAPPPACRIVLDHPHAFPLFRRESESRGHFWVAERARSFRLQPNLAEPDLLPGSQDGTEFCFVGAGLRHGPPTPLGGGSQTDVAERFPPLLPHTRGQVSYPRPLVRRQFQVVEDNRLTEQVEVSGSPQDSEVGQNLFHAAAGFEQFRLRAGIVVTFSEEFLVVGQR